MVIFVLNKIKMDSGSGIQIRKQSTDVSMQTSTVTKEFKTSQITESTQSKSYQYHGNSNLRNFHNAENIIKDNQWHTQVQIKIQCIFDIKEKQKPGL